MPSTVTPPSTARPGDLVALVAVDTYAGTYELAAVTEPRPADDREPIARVDRVVILRDGRTVLELDWMRDEDAGRIGRTSRALTVTAPAVPAHAAVPGSATDCTCGRTFGSHMGRRNHLTAAAKRAANEQATAARMAEVKAEASLHVTAASLRDDAATLARLAALRDAETTGTEPTDVVDLAAVDRSADHMANLAGWHPQSAAAELDHAAANARHIADRDPTLAPYQRALADALDRRAAAARPTMTLTGFGAALLDTAECEHGVPMTDPCGPCAIAGHEPVDVAPEHTDEECPSPTCTEYHAPDVESEHAFTGWVTGSRVCRYCDRPEAAHRHLADCRGCALHEPDGHAYESLIDVPITVEELTTLLARTDLADGERAAVELTRTEKVAEREWMDRLMAQTDEEAAAEGWGTDPTA